jgi:3-deoxy-7-phosphoheptulonate synthase
VSKRSDATPPVAANGAPSTTLQTRTDDLRVLSFEPLLPPAELTAELPLTPKAAATVVAGRAELRDTLVGRDKRLVVITGPCSIHDPDAAYEYAEKLAVVRKKVAETVLVVMRVYFEKPRTTVGWKGLINDPHLDGTHDIVHGLRLARRILLKINELGVPCATEFLDPIVPQYSSDLVSWAAIGARTTESQTHRQMASGLSMPVGFKNATDGGLQVALDAMAAARAEHAFVGIDAEGRTSIVKTAGNPDVHVVLRGGASGPNFSKADIAYTKALLEAPAGARQIMIDCSHGNTSKNFMNQPRVFDDVLTQSMGGESSILGVMIESHLVEGRQDVQKRPLTYGQSVTDGCLGWAATEDLLLKAHEKLQALKG